MRAALCQSQADAPSRSGETRDGRTSKFPNTSILGIFGNSVPQSSVNLSRFAGNHSSAKFCRCSGSARQSSKISVGVRLRAGGEQHAVPFGSGGIKMSRICLAAGLSFALLGGCASVGNESIADATYETVSAQLVKGKTRQQQVRELYGDPVKTSFTDSGNEIWEYDFSRMHSKPTNFIPYVNLIHSGAEGDKKSLLFFSTGARSSSSTRSARRKSMSARA